MANDAATKEPSKSGDLKATEGTRTVDRILQTVGAGFTSGLVISVFLNQLKLRSELT